MWVCGCDSNVLNQNDLKWNSHLQIQNSRMCGVEGKEGGKGKTYILCILYMVLK